MIRLRSDLQRAEGVIVLLGLRGPHDGPGEFTFPRPGTGERLELADVVYDLADEWAARAVLDAPSRHRVSS